jgi:hypothetical protein
MNETQGQGSAFDILQRRTKSSHDFMSSLTINVKRHDPAQIIPQAQADIPGARDMSVMAAKNAQRYP